MEEIFKQYGAPIIIVSVIVALIVIFGILLSTTGSGGIIMDNFKNLISEFFDKANFTSGAAGEVTGTVIAGILG